jgi:hypothetical protein
MSRRGQWVEARNADARARADFWGGPDNRTDADASREGTVAK